MTHGQIDVALLQTLNICLIGAGKMGAAMLESWLRCGVSGSQITVRDPHLKDTVAALCKQYNVAVNTEPLDCPDILVLAIKPQMLDVLVSDITRLISSKTLILSILAGKSIADLAKRFSGTDLFVRAMPNLPASIGYGATGVVSSAHVPEILHKAVDVLLRAVGSVEWLESEDLVNTVAAISGSGPAYVFLLAECLAQAGVNAGLPSDLAQRLARQTVIGSGLLLKESSLPPATLRENVTSPGGTTAAALRVLLGEKGIQPLMEEAVRAAEIRAEELSG